MLAMQDKAVTDGREVETSFRLLGGGRSSNAVAGHGVGEKTAAWSRAPEGGAIAVGEGNLKAFITKLRYSMPENTWPGGGGSRDRETQSITKGNARSGTLRIRWGGARISRLLLPCYYSHAEWDNT